MHDFKIGDYVRCTSPDKYTITTPHAKCKVVYTRPKTHPDTDISVEVIDHPEKNVIGRVYEVDSSYFKHEHTPSVISKTFGAKVGDKLLVTTNAIKCVNKGDIVTVVAKTSDCAGFTYVLNKSCGTAMPGVWTLYDQEFKLIKKEDKIMPCLNVKVGDKVRILKDGYMQANKGDILTVYKINRNKENYLKDCNGFKLTGTWSLYTTEFEHYKRGTIMLEKVKQFTEENKKVFLYILIALAVDHVFFKGEFTNKIKNLFDRLLNQLCDSICPKDAIIDTKTEEVTQ